jgi:hypothetical protein
VWVAAFLFSSLVETLKQMGLVEDGLDVGGKVDSNLRGGIGALVGFDVVGLEVGIKLGFVEVGFDVGGKVVGIKLGFVEVGFDVGGKVDSNWRGGIGGLDVGINDELGLGSRIDSHSYNLHRLTIWMTWI